MLTYFFFGLYDHKSTIPAVHNEPAGSQSSGAFTYYLRPVRPQFTNPVAGCPVFITSPFEIPCSIFVIHHSFTHSHIYSDTFHPNSRSWGVKC